MAKENSIRKTEILDEIIDNATCLPIESQNLLLMLAKAMAYTRDCIARQNKGAKPQDHLMT